MTAIYFNILLLMEPFKPFNCSFYETKPFLPSFKLRLCNLFVCLIVSLSVCVRVCLEVRGQNHVSSTVTFHSMFLRYSLLLNLEPIHYTRLAGQWAPGIHLSVLPQRRDSRQGCLAHCCMGSGDLNASPRSSMAAPYSILLHTPDHL